MALATLISASALTQQGLAQENERFALIPQFSHACLLPDDPMTDDDMLREISSSLRQELSRYFDEMTAYIKCLDDSRIDAMTRANEILRWYQPSKTE